MSLKESEILSYDEWYDLYEKEIRIELAESGADRELCFDSEKEYEKRYVEYVEKYDSK